MSLEAALRRAEAPDELIAWVEEAGEQEAWDGNDRGDWSLWMAAARGVPIGRLHTVALDALAVLRARFDRPPALLQTLDATLQAAATADGTVLLARAEESEALGAASSPVGADYRVQAPPGARALARATALLARAVEARLAARAALEQQLGLEALVRAGSVGVPQFVMQPAIGELTIFSASRDQPSFAPLVYALDAAGEAMREAARAVAGDDDSRTEEADAEIADLLFESLDRMIARL
ncbi:MAG: hypothetical protein AAGN82_13520 [Myxococcota bacterium]